MFRISTHMLLACLLLLSQIALASHDVEHLDSAHSNECAVYLLSDHSAHGDSFNDPIAVDVLPDRFQVDAVDVFVAIQTTVYVSRAPPKKAFS